MVAGWWTLEVRSVQHTHTPTLPHSHTHTYSHALSFSCCCCCRRCCCCCERLSALGQKGSVAEVKRGYGRNFLVPKGYALFLNKETKAFIDPVRTSQPPPHVLFTFSCLMKGEGKGRECASTRKSNYNNNAFKIRHTTFTHTLCFVWLMATEGKISR